MAKGSSSFLKPKSTANKSLSVKIDPSIFAQLEEIEQRIENEAPEFSLSRSDIVENAIVDAVKVVEKELDKMKRSATPTPQAAPQPA